MRTIKDVKIDSFHVREHGDLPGIELYLLTGETIRINYDQLQEIFERINFSVKVQKTSKYSDVYNVKKLVFDLDSIEKSNQKISKFDLMQYE